MLLLLLLQTASACRLASSSLRDAHDWLRLLETPC
jgi:hypothetical protein